MREGDSLANLHQFISRPSPCAALAFITRAANAESDACKRLCTKRIIPRFLKFEAAFAAFGFADRDHRPTIAAMSMRPATMTKLAINMPTARTIAITQSPLD